MKKIVIFGTGGHAKVILSELLKQKKYKEIIFVSKEKKSIYILTKKNIKFLTTLKLNLEIKVKYTE